VSDGSFAHDRIILRLVLVNLESGTCASAVSIATLVWYLEHPSEASSIVIVSLLPTDSLLAKAAAEIPMHCVQSQQSLFMARVYLMNMLYNLSMRGSGYLMRDDSNQSHIHRISGYVADSASLPLSHLPSSNKGGLQHNVVHVSQSVETHVDKVSMHVSVAIRKRTFPADACC
jgi:hypothetical protein